jgi:hypothetical protein
MPKRGTLEHQMYQTMCRLYELVFIHHRETEDRITALEKPPKRKKRKKRVSEP